MAKILKTLFGKKEKLVVGLMSGTSKDGIDAAIVRMKGSGPGTALEIIGFLSVPYEPPLRQRTDRC